MSSLLIKGARLFDPGSGHDEVGDLLIEGAAIAAVGEVEPSGSEEVIEAAGLWVLPGMMDLHVHLREPGQEEKETIATGTAAAAAGGFTSVVCEPNTKPPCDSVERLLHVRDLAAREALVKVLPKCAITRGQFGKELTDLKALREAGAVAASDDGFAVKDARVMREAMLAAKTAGLPLTVHVEGAAMVARDIGLAAELDWCVHFSHVSLAEEAELIARARARGLRVTGEASPHHLVLCDEDAPTGDANFKMNPPLARASDRAAVRAAVASGVLTVIASDHAPHTPEEKAAGYEQAPPGVIGLETTLAVVWTCLVHQQRADAEMVVRALTVGPAEVLGLEAPALRPGARADVVLLDPAHAWVVDPMKFRSKARNCPFAGRKLRGKAVATVIGGRLVMKDGAILTAGGQEPWAP
jgi:dihydroorotase